jgi:hypothetical protein
VSLPEDRHVAGLSRIEQIARGKRCAKEDLDILEGQLNNAAWVIPLARHFLIRLRASQNSRTNKKSWIKFASLVLADLVLWMEATAQKGLTLESS